MYNGSVITFGSNQTNPSVLAVVEDLAECDDDADDDSNDDKNEWTCERRHVDTARFIDVQRRLYVRHHPLRVGHVPTLTSLDEPATSQRLQDTHSKGKGKGSV